MAIDAKREFITQIHLHISLSHRLTRFTKVVNPSTAKAGKVIQVRSPCLFTIVHDAHQGVIQTTYEQR